MILVYQNNVCCRNFSLLSGIDSILPVMWGVTENQTRNSLFFLLWYSTLCVLEFVNTVWIFQLVCRVTVLVQCLLRKVCDLTLEYVYIHSISNIYSNLRYFFTLLYIRVRNTRNSCTVAAYLLYLEKVNFP